jgi:hypothetical protein
VSANAGDAPPAPGRNRRLADDAAPLAGVDGLFVPASLMTCVYLENSRSASPAFSRQSRGELASHRPLRRFAVWRRFFAASQHHPLRHRSIVATSPGSNGTTYGTSR